MISYGGSNNSLSLLIDTADKIKALKLLSKHLFAWKMINKETCLLYTSDAAEDLLCVDLGGRRIIKKKKIKNKKQNHAKQKICLYTTH